MSRINLLNVETSNKIAAGEVVERPSSVVKELLENSIDAQAKNITIEIEDGGEKLIRIIDDGIGIHPEDIDKAFLPHATSKIRSIEDIYGIYTLGFRGEALASIASVSHTKLTSKTKDFEYGREITINGGTIDNIMDSGSNDGTIIEVKEIFFNVPARKKFLKSTSREGAIITDIVNKIALSHADISISLYNNGKKTIRTYGTDDTKDCIRAIYGKNIVDNLVYFEGHIDEATVYGYIGNEELSRGSRNNQSIFVNKRYIKNRSIVSAVENAFKSFLPINKFPFFILFLDIFPELIDVNIHPTKVELKFFDERKIFKLVFDSIHEALRKALHDSFVLPEEQKKSTSDTNYENISYLSKEPYEDKVIISNDKDSTISETKPNDTLYQAMNSIDTKSTFISDTAKVQGPVKCCNIKKQVDIPSDLKSAANFNNVSPKLPPIKIIGQFNKTYILGEYNSELYLIDQHAAHEKVLFEKYREEIKAGEVMAQPLLIPLVLELTYEDYSIFMENKDIFEKSGFSIDIFGDNTLNIKECPYILGKANLKNFFFETLDDIKNLGSGNTEDIKYDKIAQMACKKAVKANEELTIDEMIHLIDTLKYINDPYTCPHGRPTIIKFNLYELEKRFKRIQ